MIYFHKEKQCFIFIRDGYMLPCIYTYTLHLLKKSSMKFIQISLLCIDSGFENTHVEVEYKGLPLYI